MMPLLTKWEIVLTTSGWWFDCVEAKLRCCWPYLASSATRPLGVPAAPSSLCNGICGDPACTIAWPNQISA